MPDLEATLAQARAALREGRFDAADALFRQVVAVRPDDPESLLALGLAAGRRGALADANAWLEHDHARPGDPGTLFALGGTRMQTGDLDGAIDALQRAVDAAPAHGDAWRTLALALERVGRIGPALLAVRRAATVRPRHAPTATVLARLLLDAGHPDEAIAACERAIGLNERAIDAHSTLGRALRKANRHAEAVAAFERALTIRPNAPHLRTVLGMTLLDEGRAEEAIAEFDRALALEPDLPSARWQRRMALPVLYEDEASIETWRRRFETGLAALESGLDVSTAARAEAERRALEHISTFRLNYQGRNDRPLQERFGALVHRVVGALHPDRTQPIAMPPRDPDGRIRVGLVSAHFTFHAAARLALGFVERADRARFHYTCYHLGTGRDAFTQRFEEAAGTWRDGLYSIADAVQAVSDDRPHVLIYTDIGMKPVKTQLAALRLAPVQAVLWGHPVTTGLPTMDVFLTSDAMEPPGGADHYRERLVALPGLGVCYPRPVLPETPRSRAALGLPPRDEAFVYLAIQSLYKYLPQHDEVFAAIAARVPAAHFVFIASRSDHLTGLFRARLQRAFRREGLDAERHCLIRDRCPPDEFLDVLAAGDAYLDSIGWSGGNTTLEALEAGRAVVTVPGAFMRGRHSAAMLDLMDLPELIAPDLEAYVEIAARLALDEAFRATMERRVAERRARLFDDDAPVRALEAHLTEWVDRGGIGT